ncbi:MAG: hypothetical protein ACJ79W_09105 [Myxococcales bacterium]
MDPRSYIEAIAQELSRTGGRGLVLSSAEAQLALDWHAQGIPLADIVAELRRVLREEGGVARGATRLRISLQLVESAIAARHPRKRPQVAEPPAFFAGLLSASRADLPSPEVWRSLAARAEDLLAQGAEAYWSEAVAALTSTLRRLPRDRVRALGKALRARMAPRPASMTRDVYRRSLQLQLLSAASERLGVPPREFLL